ncbi:MAG: bifunctional diguanylate cyclase/phosphohydrolase, partial [Bacillota bacterium]
KKLLEQHQQLKEMHAALQKAMITDRLTDLGNREHYEQQLLETETKEPWPCGILLLDVCGLSLINDSLGYEQGNLLLKKVAAVLKRYESEQISCYRIDGDGFAVLFKNLPEENIKQQVNTLLQDLASVTIDVANTRVLFSYGLAISNQECSLQDLHWQADRDLNQGKQNERNQAQMSIISSLQAALEERDYMTEAHAERLEQLADIFAVALDLTPQDRAHLRAFMLMHDIGKVGIPDRILLKPGRLTAQEMKIMQRHSSIGYRIAMASPEMAPIAKYILHHHERWDGTGYPAGLKGDDIPLLCRILAIIDAFDAMTNDRPYRRAMPEEKAIKELQRCAGSQFDPYLVQLFVEHVLPRQKTSHS